MREVTLSPSDAFKPVIAKLSLGETLSREEAHAAFDAILGGGLSESQIAAFLMALRVRGEHWEEIIGAVMAMRARMVRVNAPADAIDIVGTGGDNAGTYNVSTLTSLIVAACGVTVAKHGNRAASSKSGAADVLTALGVTIGLDAAGVERCLAQVQVGFMFAPNHHASMRHVAPVRQQLGIRTIFNVLGPLSNPAGVTRQLLGVFSETWMEPLAHALSELGTRHAWIVHGRDGLDEMTTTDETLVCELKDGQTRRFVVTPEEAGLPRASLADLRGGDPETNAKALRQVLQGTRTAYRDIAVFNAAAALIIAGRAETLRQGAELAAAALDSGSAQTVLDKLIAVSAEAAS